MCGDDYNPLCTEEMRVVSEGVGRLCTKWRNMTKDCVLATTVMNAPVRQMCGQRLGGNNCITTERPDVVNDIDLFVANLREWLQWNRPKATPYNDVWQPLTLLYYGPEERPAGCLEPPGMAILSMFTEWGPFEVIACRRRIQPPQLGDVVAMPADIASVTHAPFLARMGA
eukprot:8291252-Pyramimonas_sp.AAC.1